MILGSSVSSLGALLVGIGALLRLAQAAGGSVGLTGTTWGGTIALPLRRLGSGMEFAGAALVAAGSVLLLLASSQLGVFSVLLTVVVAAVIICTVMAVRLRAHLDLVAREGTGPRRSLWWCLRHPAWRPPAS